MAVFLGYVDLEANFSSGHKFSCALVIVNAENWHIVRKMKFPLHSLKVQIDHVSCLLYFHVFSLGSHFSSWLINCYGCVCRVSGLCAHLSGYLRRLKELFVCNFFPLMFRRRNLSFPYVINKTVIRAFLLYPENRRCFYSSVRMNSLAVLVDVLAYCIVKCWIRQLFSTRSWDTMLN